MTKFQFLSTVLITTVLIVGTLFFANYYLDQQDSVLSNWNEPIERPIRRKPTQDPERTPELIPSTIEGRIVGVTDGDTVKVLTAENRLYIIRLAGIDAPEPAQDFGKKSKEYLSKLIFDQAVRINATKIDKYGRTLGQIYIGEKDINLEIVRAGLAWHYKKYEVEQTDMDRKLYADAEILARKKKVGLWSMRNPTPPWIFRHPELSQS